MCATYSIFITSLFFVEKATKYCGEDGQWFHHPESNKTWTNYTLCAVNTKERLKVIYPPILSYPPQVIVLIKHLGNYSELTNTAGFLQVSSNSNKSKENYCKCPQDL